MSGIRVIENGPYVVSGEVPLVRKRIIESEHGEPLTWETPDPVERGDDGEGYALCRCGGSGSKPFCDGTHARSGFDGSASEGDPPGERYDERAKAYPGAGIVVRDDRGLCVHAGFCGNRVTNVWKLTSKTDDSVTRAQVMAMVELCPSGALTYRMEADGRDVEPDLPAQVAVIADGPLWVSGGVRVEGPDGRALEPRNRVTLCRCGESAHKPLCDGSHKDAGFSDGA